MTVVASNYARRAKRGEAQIWLARAISYEGGDCLVWPFWRSAEGYGRATIDGRKWLVSRFVCERVHGPAPTPFHQAAHSCGNGAGGCVNPMHLRWATAAENTADKRVHGTLVAARPGMDNINARLSVDDVREIRRLFGRVKQVDLAARFGICQSNVSSIGLGKTWGHV